MKNMSTHFFYYFYKAFESFKSNDITKDTKAVTLHGPYFYSTLYSCNFKNNKGFLCQLFKIHQIGAAVIQTYNFE